MVPASYTIYYIVPTQTKTIAMMALIAIATIAAIEIGIGTATQSAHKIRKQLINL